MLSDTFRSRMGHDEAVYVLGVAALRRLAGSCAVGSQWSVNPELSHMFRSQMVHVEPVCVFGRCCIAPAGRAPVKQHCPNDA